MEKKYYIYLFLDSSKPGEYIYDDIKLEYEPFYVGKGCGDRIKSSLFDRESPFKVNKIKSLRDNKIEIISIKLFENLENEESLEIEKDVIKKIGRRDLKLGPLTNLTDGGNQTRNYKYVVSDETKQKISNGLKNSELFQKAVRSKERVNKISESNKGKKRSDETKNKISESLKGKMSGENNPFYGKEHSEDSISKMSEKASQRIGDKNGFYGKEHKEETKQKISISLKNKQKKIYYVYDTSENLIICDTSEKLLVFFNSNTPFGICRRCDSNKKYKGYYIRSK